MVIVVINAWFHNELRYHYYKSHNLINSENFYDELIFEKVRNSLVPYVTQHINYIKN